MLALWGSVGVLGTLAAVGCEVWYRRLDPRGRLTTAKDARMNPRVERVVCWLAIVACFGLLAYAALSSPARGADPAAEEAEEDPTLETRRAMLARNNTIRTARSLKPHKENVALMAAAQDHSRYMAKTRVFSHYTNGGPGGRAARYEFKSFVRENIGYGYGNVDQAFTGWFNSGAHRSSMLSDTSDAGFGWSLAVDGTPYWVAVYGTPPREPGDEPAEDPPSTPPAAGGNGNNFGGGFFRRIGRWIRR